MRRLRRTTPAHSRSVDPATFDRAAHERGFTLDSAQRAAAHLLADADRNLYLWGPVGRGKSWLMDVYFEALDTDRKMRVHFHEFFRDLHVAIRRNGFDLAAALSELLAGVDVVCFDEFHVHDPADGKFIARVIPALLDRRARVIVTSNHAPRSLLPNPLFHDGFLPTIDLIERSMTVTSVAGPLDYRTVAGHASGFAQGIWISPGTSEQLAGLGHIRPAPGRYRTVSPAGHAILVRGATDGLLWIDFADLCESTTAPVDYLALVRAFRHWVVDHVPDLRTVEREPAQRFANVIDVLYDNDVSTTFVSAHPLDLAAGGLRAILEAERVASRLGSLTRIDVPADR